MINLNEYRIPGDPNMGHWPLYEGDGLPPEPYLRKWFADTRAGETVPCYGGNGDPCGKMFTYPSGSRKAVWVLVGKRDGPAEFVPNELTSYSEDGLPEFIPPQP